MTRKTMGNTTEGASPLRRAQSHYRTASGTVMTADPRSSDRTLHYTLKTSGRPPPASSHSHSHSQSHSHSHPHSHSNPQSFRPSKSSTPMASPRLPHSVGQQYPPRLSPSVTRINTQDVRTPSPNYFGLIVEQSVDPRDSAVLPRDNWSPPTSSVKSFGAVIPKQLPLDANPEFEAFRRQADANRGRSGFGLSTFHFGGSAQAATGAATAPLLRPRPPRWHTHTSDSVSDASKPQPSTLAGRGQDATGNRMDVDADSLHDSAYVSSDSKRNSESSLNPPSFLNAGRHESPASFESPFAVPQGRRSNLSAVDDRHPRLSMMEGKADRPTPDPAKAQRAETVPTALESGGPSMIMPAQLKDLVERARGAAQNELLLLDLRVSPQYAHSRIQGALNLCIPTTLLKRATFNLQKLQSTFQNDREQARFAAWRGARCLVVYDAFSSEKRDAVSALNMIKKFTNEGYSGATHILRGGFNTFSAMYPHLVDNSSGDPAPGLSLNPGAASERKRPSVAPVIGGVVLPNAMSNSNPFFGNIRQNMDLADGVGQMDLSLPADLDDGALPGWLRTAAEAGDHGKKVADKFLQIELKEQSRMKDAYSVFNAAVASASQRPRAGEDQVRLSGLEKGGKNRYKDILPFEHARVKLQGRAEGMCDYINASHIKARRSHKRYIASQGPLPATFEDFWTVIWDQDVRVIVMLTAESEGGQLKCHPYWKARDFGPIKLRPLSEKKVSLDIDKHRSSSIASGSLSSQSSASNQQTGFTFPTPSQAEAGRRRANTTTTLESSTPTPMHPSLSHQTGSSGTNTSSALSETPYVIIRKFAISHAAHPFAPIREITHLHYPSWPDFGAPAQPSHLLALVELANVMQRAALPVNVSGPLSTPGRSPSVGDRANPPDHRAGSQSRHAALPLSWRDEPERDVNARPMLVHCSAGCGRTGAFCTVDSVIDMLKRQRHRAIRIANRRIAERERRFAAQLAAEKEARRREMDADGDVAMSDDDATSGTGGHEDDYDAISPLATLKGPATSALFPADTPVGAGGRTPTATSAPELGALGPGTPFASASTPGQGYGADDDSEEDTGRDIDLSWLDDDAVDLVAATVADFRTQRLSMVQSLRQFVLCYESIAEWIWRLQERGGVAAVGINSGRPSSVSAGGRLRSGSLNVRS